jgi:hypothetical protein
LCRKLAISQAAKGRTFDEVCKAALGIARQWRWDQNKAGRLVEDLKQYYHCKGLFAGGQADGVEWWESLEISADKHPFQSFAITILSIVPHSVDVECLFSNLGGVQGVKRCNFTVDTFEMMGKLRAKYAYHIFQCTKALRRSTCRHHAHMHTCEGGGINVGLAADILQNFTWTPPLAPQSDNNLEGPEAITDEDIEAAFTDIEWRDVETRSNIDPIIEGSKVEAAKVYDLEVLTQVEKGLAPGAFNDKIRVVDMTAGATNWDISSLLRAKGVSA